MSLPDSVAERLGTCPLAAKNRVLFSALVEQYAETIQLAVEEVVVKVDRNVFPRLKTIARQAGEQDAVPQDLIAIHLVALADLLGRRPRNMARACVRHSRLLLVKMVGELALYYRDRMRHQRPETANGAAKT